LIDDLERQIDQINRDLKASGAAATAAADIYPGLGTPQQVFSALTGLFGSGDDEEPEPPPPPPPSR